VATASDLPFANRHAARNISRAVKLPALLPDHGTRHSADQDVRFCRGRDGGRLAWAIHGSGPPVIVVSCWLSHLQHDWRSPVWHHFLRDLGEFATIVRYDERGFGMSDWNVTDFSLEARHGDLEALVEATGFERFALLGMSGGSPVAMAYAARHPERVTRLMLYGTVSAEPTTFEGNRLDVEQTFRSMIRVGWATEDPLFRRVFTRIYIPNASEEQMRWFDDLQRMSTSPENAVASRLAQQAVDIADEIPRIDAPTLILHAVGDRATAFANAVKVAGQIPDARLVELDSGNHILLADEPAWAKFLSEVRAFLGPERWTEDGLVAKPVERLSRRELDVLRVAARGLGNEAIAAELGLSVRTVERHLSNAYGKLGVAGKAARAAAVAVVLRRGLA
jgi:pimeloyl-ACP methyl ester carboxylesterase/DNA-binding CsgD family transcriptional regulator